MQKPPIVLCFSGHDPSGGAGIQADQAAIHNLGAHCASVITALTVQNTANVLNFTATSAELVIQQADALVADMPIHAIKIGMLGSLANVEALCQWLQRHPKIPVILDPVTIASGGGALGNATIVEAINEQLLPHTTIVTPNAIEARQLTQTDTLSECAKILLSYGCEYVLLKGTHEPTENVLNVLYNQQGLIETYAWPRLPQDYHGSGCTLAASIAALLAQGKTMSTAVAQAQAYTWQCLAHAYQPGRAQYVPNRWYLAHCSFEE